MADIVIPGNRLSARRAAWVAALSVGALAPAQSAYADDLVPAPAVDKSGDTLFNPTPDDEMRKFTPDRPAKGYSVRTVDAGHLEIETDFSYSNSSSPAASRASTPTSSSG